MPDSLIMNDDWSDLAAYHPLPEVNTVRLLAYRQGRLLDQMRQSNVALVILINPVSLRYVADLRSYMLYQTHIPTVYAFLGQEGEPIVHGIYDAEQSRLARHARSINFFDAGDTMSDQARLLAEDVVQYLAEFGDGCQSADLDNSNGSLDIGDIVAFLQAFASGC